MDQTNHKIITNAWVCQVQHHSIVPIFGDLIIRDGKIQALRPSDFKTFINVDPDGDEQHYNAHGRIITIPLINFHEHFYSRLAKGLPVGGDMDCFLHILENLWWKLDQALDLEMVAASARMGALESIRHGITYIFDHHASPMATKESLHVIKKVLDQYGLRSVLCFETSDRNGAELAQQGLDEFIHFTDHHTTCNIKSMLGLHASFTLNDLTLERARDIVQKYNTGIHIHLCEDQIDRALSWQNYQELPVTRLKKFNLLNSRSILAHSIHLMADDYDRILNSSSAIAYSPDSNLNNAVGLPDFNRVPEKIPVLIGTDGMHANIPGSLKQLFLLYRHQRNEIVPALHWIEKIYFDQLKFISQYFPDFPKLTVGDRADFIIWDYIPPTPVSSENFWEHLIYGILEYPIHSVVQDGYFVMRDKVIAGEEKTRKEIYLQGERLWHKFSLSQTEQ